MSKKVSSFFSYAASNHRFIVLGGPGTGKTTLMKSLVISVVKKQCPPDLNEVVPVFVSLRKLAADQRTVEDAIADAFADYHFPRAERFVESALNEGRMLVVLDGLDEVGASREYVTGRIIDFCESDDQRQQTNRVVVTCRESSYRVRDLGSVVPNIVRVEPFGNHHMRVFLQGWPQHEERSALRLYSLIQEDPQIRDICRNPLLLTLLTGLFMDTDNFQLPKSRERFYNAAVEELLIHRPGRRQIRQSFRVEDKQRVLERLCLNRLEAAKMHEDPEEFGRILISEHAAKVLPKDFDITSFVRELVEVNGIIRPSGVDMYTFAHRTIQEYFAASEAHRTRSPQDVVGSFGSRPELMQVLYFYCGLIRNIPQLMAVVQQLARTQRWVEAGLCLVYMTEIPEPTIVELVANNLYDQLARASEFKQILEVMSSLAQRTDTAFSAARLRFSEAVDLLSQTSGERNASALESVLSSSPDVAMRVVPGLLNHTSARWQKAAVLLLKDIGTDEALDRLVELLQDRNVLVRAEAARALAGLIRSRNDELKQRASLLPRRPTDDIWPLDRIFPGSLAVPIAEALGNSFDTGNRAIDCAVRALSVSGSPRNGEDEAFLRAWRRIPRDLTLQSGKNRVGRNWGKAGYVLFFGLLCSVLLLVAWARWRETILIVEPLRLQVHALDPGQLQSIKAAATAVRKSLTDAGSEASPMVDRYSHVSFDPYADPAGSGQMEGLVSTVPREQLQSLSESLEALNRKLPPSHSRFYGVAVPSAFSLSVIVPTVLTIPFVYLLFGGRGLLSRGAYRGKFDRLKFMLPTMMGMTVAANCYLLLEITTQRPFLISRLLLAYVLCGGVGCVLLWFVRTGEFIVRLHWPRNPLFSVVNDLIPISPQEPPSIAK